ncbi:secreted phosphoprotein 24 [Aulostomus maculatus]
MKSYVLVLVALLQTLRCSGIPLSNPALETMANKGLAAALAKANSIYATSHLFRVTEGSVKRVVPLGLNTVDLIIKFGTTETECLKESTADPQTCAFKPGLLVRSLKCTSRVRTFPTSTQVVSVICHHDSGSSEESSESSEEIYSRGRHHFRIPLTNGGGAAPPAALPDPSLYSHAADGRTGEGAYSNRLE